MDRKIALQIIMAVNNIEQWQQQQQRRETNLNFPFQRDNYLINRATQRGKHTYIRTNVYCRVSTDFTFYLEH